MKKCVLVFFCFMFLIQASCLAHKGVTLTDGNFNMRYLTLSTSHYYEAVRIFSTPITREGNDLHYGFVTDEGAMVIINKDARTDAIETIAIRYKPNKFYASTTACLMSVVGISPDDYIPHLSRLSGKKIGTEDIIQNDKGGYYRVCAGAVPIGDKQQDAILMRIIYTATLNGIDAMQLIVMFDWADSMDSVSFSADSKK